MTILVQEIDGVGSLTSFELGGSSGCADAWWHVETIANVPVRLDLRIGYPQPFDVIFGGLYVFALSADEFGPSAIDGSVGALSVECGPGEDTEVVANGACFDERHGPEAAPLHCNTPLLERG